MTWFKKRRQEKSRVRPKLIFWEGVFDCGSWNIPDTWDIWDICMLQKHETWQLIYNLPLFASIPNHHSQWSKWEDPVTTPRNLQTSMAKPGKSTPPKNSSPGPPSRFQISSVFHFRELLCHLSVQMVFWWFHPIWCFWGYENSQVIFSVILTWVF